MFVHVDLALLIFSGTSNSDTLVTIFPSLQITTGISINIHDQPSSVSLMQGSFSGKFYIHSYTSSFNYKKYLAHGLLH